MSCVWVGLVNPWVVSWYIGLVHALCLGRSGGSMDCVWVGRVGQWVVSW